MKEASGGARLTFFADGAELRPAAVSERLDALRATFARFPANAAGIRISGLAGRKPFLIATGPIGAFAAEFLGPGCRAVRAILLDKTAETNWSLAWHQDRVTSVKQRIDVHGFGPWSIKAGRPHVAPPFDLLSRLITLRIHLDDVPADNAPLLIAPGSHRYGRVSANRIDEVVRQCGVRQCLAEAGDVWIYATPILHASDNAAKPTRRRVLQVDFSAEELPGGLEWLGA